MNMYSVDAYHSHSRVSSYGVARTLPYDPHTPDNGRVWVLLSLLVRWSWLNDTPLLSKCQWVPAPGGPGVPKDNPLT